MEAERTQVNETISSAQQLREELRETMVELEAVISSASGAPSWLTEVEKRVVAVDVALHHHIVGVEAEDGIIPQLMRDAPWLTPQAESLRSEHGDLSKAAQEVLWEVDRLQAAPEPDGIADLREMVLKLLGQLSRHRQKGVDLVYDAYDLELGGRG